MKRTFLFGIIIFVIISIGKAQSIAKHSLKDIKSDRVEIFHSNHERAICGNILFKDETRKINDYILSHPEYQRSYRRLQKPQAYEEGDSKNWWVQIDSDTQGDVWVELPSTCMAVGDNCYIFVSDADWAAGKVTSDQIDELVNSFDNSTPNFPDKGIYDVDVDTYGEPPNFDGDEKIIIFLYDIEDDYESTGSAILGYFWSKDQFNDGDDAIGDLRSNEAEIFYIDTHPLLDIFGINQAKSTLAHEFQHMIHYGHDPNEMIFVNEGLSEIAEYVCGYGVRSNGLYTQNTNRNLLDWDYDDTLPDYSRAAFWTLYIYEQFGAEILKDFVIRHHTYWGDFSDTFNMHDANRGFFDVFEEWLIANYTNGSSTETRYVYQYSPLSKPTPVATYIGNPNGAGAGTLAPYGAEYIKFSGGSDLAITFTTDDEIKVKALKIGSLVVEDVPQGSPYIPTGYGTTFPEVTFLVYSQSFYEKNYSYVAVGAAVAGSMELAFEDGVADNAYEFNTGDSIAVWFDGIVGARLDSIKVIYNGAGRILLDISKLDGNTFLRGANIYGPINRNVQASENWQLIDLHTQNLDASEDFIVSYTIGNDPANPTISSSWEEDTNIYHSRTYTDPGDPGPTDGDLQWWIYHDGGTPQMYLNYMIRAYVSVAGTTVAIDQTGIVTIPDEFSLEQNYPNPFNPSTTFRFSTPKDGLVKFTVHDLLGRVVYSENRNLFAGNYSFTWDGQNQLDQQVVSGVYFLRMESEGFTQTRKMLMMK